MLDNFNIWFHKKALKHKVKKRQVSIGMFDFSRGLLVKCSCKKVWAL